MVFYRANEFRLGQRLAKYAFQRCAIVLFVYLIALDRALYDPGQEYFHRHLKLFSYRCLDFIQLEHTCGKKSRK